MAVLLNFKICDNAQECGGISVCPTKAISWNEKEKTIQIDNNKCISCGLCEKECPIGAFTVTKTDEEYKIVQKQIEDDPRTTKDLFVDRYGAVSISEFFRIETNEIPEKIKKNCLTLIEIYNPDYAECLLKSIPIKELTSNLPKDTLFYKAESTNEYHDYKIKKLPSLLIFKNNKLLGHIDGYYNKDEFETISLKINNILKNSD